MKTFIAITALFLFSVNSSGQVMSFISSLQVSDSGINMAEISLIHRSRLNTKDIVDLGSQVFLIPGSQNGKILKIESSRFRTTEGDPFVVDCTAYVPVYLFYDNETNDPRDDLFITSIPFEVEKELILNETKHYEGQKLVTINLKTAPIGDPAPINFSDY